MICRNALNLWSVACCAFARRTGLWNHGTPARSGHGISKTHQAPPSENRSPGATVILVPGAWDFFGVWILGFGASPPGFSLDCVPQSHRAPNRDLPRLWALAASPIL